MKALALKYRPQTFNEVVCQDSVMKVLSNQINTGEFKQAYLFAGSAGCGKTTTARIFGKAVNKGKGRIIEIDGASNNGVDNIRNLIDDCKMKSLDSEYKVYIIDECHMLSIGAWNALLKVLEEPPKGVIFILCTTDPQKIPATILSRAQRFDFTRIPTDKIVDRLKWIIATENRDEDTVISFQQEALQYIAKLADGGMRDAITKLDTVLGFSTHITVDNVLNCLGMSSYDEMSDLLKAIITQDGSECLYILDEVYMSGKDLKLFIKDVSKYILDISKYLLTNSFTLTMVPKDSEKDAMSIAQSAGLDFILDMLDSFNKLYNNVKYEQNPRAMIESEVLLLCMK
ncbi:MAG: DNA polymerase III subunit gamma/tau [Romboutsia timonensis]